MNGASYRTFGTPSLTMAQLASIERAEQREAERDAQRIDAIEDGNFDLAGGGMRASLPEVDSRFEKRLGNLSKLVTSEQNKLVPVTPPMYMLTARQRQAIFNGVNFLSETIAKNIIRPEDEHELRSLRTIEAANHSKSSSTGIQIYKTQIPNLMYANQKPHSWSEVKGEDGTTRTVFATSEAKLSNDHSHSPDDTLLIDIRQTFNDPKCVVHQPNATLIKSVHFPYTMMSPSERRSLQLRSQHTSFLTYSNSLLRSSQSSTPFSRTVAEIIENSTAQSGLALNYVQFRYDSKTLEFVYALNFEASVFGVLVFHITAMPRNVVASGGTADSLQRMPGTKELRKIIHQELMESHEKDMAAATVQQPTLGRMFDDKERRAALKEMDDLRHLANDYCKSHEQSAASAFGTRVDRLISRSCPMRISSPLKSKTLCEVKAKYAYAYFGNCQCLIDDSDLNQYKARYARLARYQHSLQPNRVPADELIPKYDSDDEAIASINSGGASSTTTKRKSEHTESSNTRRRSDRNDN